MAGRPSWQVTVDVPQVLAVALYIRDVAGVTQTSAPIDLPEAAPSVAADGTVLPLPEVTAQWNGWWTRALTIGPHALKELEPPHFPAFADAPALQDLLRVHFDDARRWSADRKRSSVGTNRSGLPLGELVSKVEQGMGRAAAPFRLHLDVVPVAGHGMWKVRPGHMLVSSALLDEPALLVARLRPEVELLA
jgi:hypothetical protein